MGAAGHLIALQERVVDVVDITLAETVEHAPALGVRPTPQAHQDGAVGLEWQLSHAVADIDQHLGISAVDFGHLHHDRRLVVEPALADACLAAVGRLRGRPTTGATSSAAETASRCSIRGLQGPDRAVTGVMRLHNGGHELKRAERCPSVQGTPVALCMELINYCAIIYVQLSARWPCYDDSPLPFVALAKGLAQHAVILQPMGLAEFHWSRVFGQAFPGQLSLFCEPSRSVSPMGYLPPRVVVDSFSGRLTV